MDGSPFGAGGDSLSLAVDPSGQHLYSVDGGATSGGSIWAFNIDPKSGELSPVPGSPFMTGQQASEGIAVDPKGKFAYVSDYVEGGGKIGELSAYEIESSGALRQVKGSPFPTGRNSHPLWSGDRCFGARLSTWQTTAELRSPPTKSGATVCRKR